MISHDLNLVRNFCDRVLIMYAGRVVETLAARDMDRAQHPYTCGLLAAQPRIGGPATAAVLANGALPLIGFGLALAAL